MNRKIRELTEKLAEVETLRTSEAAKIKVELQDHYNKVFDDSKELEKAILNAQDASMYQCGAYGEIESWYRWSGLSDFSECREYFVEWLAENHCMRVDWGNDCLLSPQGDDCLIIQDDTRHGRDNGVWENGKCVISEDVYKEDGEDVDEEKRNSLIEAHMTRTGYFPGVFRVDQHGNVTYVNTHKKGGDK